MIYEPMYVYLGNGLKEQVQYLILREQVTSVHNFEETSSIMDIQETGYICV